LHVVAVDNPDWTPGREFVESVFSYFDVTSIGSVSGRAGPPDPPSGLDRAPYLFGRYSLSCGVTEALEITREQRAPVTLIIVDYRGWDHRLIDSLQRIPPSLSGRFCPHTLAVTIGPFVIVSRDHESVLGCFGFEVNISGDGMPIEWDAYLEAAKGDTELRKLLEFLSEQSGKDWEVFISSSY
jgi:hypothetical protein